MQKYKIKLFLPLFFLPLIFTFGPQVSCHSSAPGPVADDLIISPAEGRVTAISELDEGQTPFINDAGKTALLSELSGKLKGRSRLLLIVMSLFDHHGVVSPIAGDVQAITPVSGSFRNILSKDAYLENERITMVIDGKIRVAVIPIAGHYYRRIICQVRPKEKVFRGQALGRIMLGSAVVVLLPVECEILVKPGEKVDAGKSVIGRITQPLRAKAGPIRP